MTLNGIGARIWEGTTESGIAVHAYITRIAVRNEADNSQFQAELIEQKTPSADVSGIPMRMIL